jgi:hypothetical protein
VVGTPHEGHAEGRLPHLEVSLLLLQSDLRLPQHFVEVVVRPRHDPLGIQLFTPLLHVDLDLDLLGVDRRVGLLVFLSHRIICKCTDANCSPSPRSIAGYQIHREVVTLSYLYNIIKINVANTY